MTGSVLFGLLWCVIMMKKGATFFPAEGGGGGGKSSGLKCNIVLLDGREVQLEINVSKL